jgi:hypothetical protein
MIPVAPVPEPADFDRKARVLGQAWLAAHPDAKRPRDLWSPFRPVLEEGFGRRCGYAAMLDPTGGTVDHYLSCDTHRHLAYEWSNYRFVSGTLNSSKRTADDAVLDPYEVQDGWFEILLPSLQMRTTNAVPPPLRAKADYTLTRLKLRDGERVIRWRQSWYELYKNGQLTLEGLREVAPLIAAAVDRIIAKGGNAP